MYESIGYSCLLTSVVNKEGIEDFKNVLIHKKSLLAGHSGVGKSSLVNEIAPGLELRTSEVSTFANKGVHTTTFAEMFQLDANSFIIDTPGIKELGLMEIGEEELSHYFPEMRALIGQCKYHNCTHVHEPKCAVIEAINHSVPETRYLSYLSMLENSDNRR
jgi:ribosome biogenesis GTPase